MNSVSMETMFLMISGAILLAGVFYWFWSLIQLTQTKILLIENAVFELRGLISQSLHSGTNDKVNDEVNDKVNEVNEVNAVKEVNEVNEVNEDNDDEYEWPLKQEKETVNESNSELRPGGVPMDIDEKEKEKEKTVDIRSFLTNFEQPIEPTPPLLESMPVKELRRLAEQRGIPGVSEMRKKELISAIRQQVVKPVELTENENENENEQLIEEDIDVLIEHVE